MNKLVYLYVCIYSFLYAHTCILICTYAYTYMYIYVYMYAHMCILICTYAHTYTRTYAYIYTRIMRVFNLVPRVSLLCLPCSNDRGRQRTETLGTRLARFLVNVYLSGTVGGGDDAVGTTTLVTLKPYLGEAMSTAQARL